MKLWHDDIRRPPNPSWDAWARTNDEAKQALLFHGVIGNPNTDGADEVIDVISLDHDLGLHYADPDEPDAWLRIGQGESTGLDLIDWMVANGLVPKMVYIHSMNSVGAIRMKAALITAAERGLIQHHLTVSVQPYTPGAQY